MWEEISLKHWRVQWSEISAVDLTKEDEDLKGYDPPRFVNKNYDEVMTSDYIQPNEERFETYEDAEKRATELETCTKCGTSLRDDLKVMMKLNNAPVCKCGEYIGSVRIKITTWDGDCCMEEMVS